MKKVAFAGVVVASLWWAVQDVGRAQQPDEPPPAAGALTIQATTVADLRTWDAFVVGGSRSGALRVRSVERDPALPNRIIERFEQFHRGVRIWGADIVRDSERGVPLSIFGMLSPELTLSIDPALSEAAARQTLLNLGGDEPSLLTTPELVILLLDSGDHRLAYTAVVAGSRDVLRVFIDAQNGAGLMRYTEIKTQAAVGSGTGVLGDSKKLSVQRSGGTYVTSDNLRPTTIQTFDMRGNVTRAAQSFSGQLNYNQSDLASDSDNVWSDVAVVDAHVHIGWTYDYYFQRFGRRLSGPIDLMVNALSQQGALSLPLDLWGVLVQNANWCNFCGPSGRGRLFFGNGFPAGVSSPIDGRNWTYLSGALDIAAHELTHAVTDATSGLAYHNESGALNEAFSDMMGKSVEFFYHKTPGSGVGQADYVLGKDVIRAARPGTLAGIRSMANPMLYGDPDHYSRRKIQPDTLAGDWGGVHTNSGIPNHAFYLAIEGGTNRTSSLAVQGVGAGNREQIEKVFYRAFTLLLPMNATFSMARIITIQAARDLYGAGSVVERAVTQAWDAVGVTNTSSSTITMPTLTGTMPSSRDAGYYVITMPGTGRYQAVLNWSDPGVDLDLLIGRPGCVALSCMLALARSATQRPETVCLQVRAGEDYWVWIETFGPRSTSYALGQTISLTTSTTCSASFGAETTQNGSADKGDGPPRDHAQQLH